MGNGMRKNNITLSTHPKRLKIISVDMTSCLLMISGIYHLLLEHLPSLIERPLIHINRATKHQYLKQMTRDTASQTREYPTLMTAVNDGKQIMSRLTLRDSYEKLCFKCCIKFSTPLVSDAIGIIYIHNPGVFIASQNISDMKN